MLCFARCCHTFDLNCQDGSCKTTLWVSLLLAINQLYWPAEWIINNIAHFVTNHKNSFVKTINRGYKSRYDNIISNQKNLTKHDNSNKCFIIPFLVHHSELFHNFLIVPSFQLKTSLHYTVKPVLSSHSKNVPKIGFQLMQVKSIVECSKGSILQYFRPSLSYHFPLRPLFCLFLSGRLRQVSLYMQT